MLLTKQVAPSAVPKVMQERCQGCRRCTARDACAPKAVVIVDRGEPAWIDSSRCLGCGVCVLACAFGAITMRQ